MGLGRHSADPLPIDSGYAETPSSAHSESFQHRVLKNDFSSDVYKVSWRITIPDSRHIEYPFTRTIWQTILFRCI